MTLVEMVHTLTAEVTQLRAEGTDLRARLQQTSQNASKPPSSDPSLPQDTPQRHRSLVLQCPLLRSPADTVVPGNASGGMDGIAVKPLTVSFSEPGFLSKANQENQFGPWFTLSNQERQQLGSPMGPANPQALNRYAYVMGNPLKYTDPSGHEAICTSNYSACTGGRVVNSSSHSILVKGDMVLADGTVLRDLIFRLEAGQSSIELGIIDVDEIYVDQVNIDGYRPGYGTKVDDGRSVTVQDTTNGELTVGRGDIIPGIWSQWYMYKHGDASVLAGSVDTSRGVNMNQTLHITGPDV